jgi:hypothetical protein
VGVRTRRQVQLDEEDVVKQEDAKYVMKEEDAKDMVKEEDSNTEDPELDLVRHRRHPQREVMMGRVWALVVSFQ